MTARVDDSAEALAMRLGVHSYLAKPYKMPVLRNQVRQVLLVRALRKELSEHSSLPAAEEDPDRPPGQVLTAHQLEVLLRIAATQT